MGRAAPRTRTLAGAAVLGLAIAGLPQPAQAAAALTINPFAFAGITLDLNTCDQVLTVHTSAQLSPAPGARFTSIEVNWNGAGAPLGKYDSHTYSGGTTFDHYIME